MKKFHTALVLATAVAIAPFAQAADAPATSNYGDSSHFFVEGNVGQGTISFPGGSDSSSNYHAAVGVIGSGGNVSAKIFFGQTGKVGNDTIKDRGISVSFDHSFKQKVSGFVTAGYGNAKSSGASGIQLFAGVGGRYHFNDHLSASLEYDHYFAVLKVSGPDDGGKMNGLQAGARYSF